MKAWLIEPGDVYKEGDSRWMVRSVTKRSVRGGSPTIRLRLAAGRTDKGFEVDHKPDDEVDIWRAP